MDFAKQKLLDGTIGFQEKDWSRSLVCLSVCFALGFNSDATARDMSVMQVGRYERLLLAVTAGGEKFVTVAGCRTPSSRGCCTYELTKRSDASPIPHLANHTDLNCVDRGQRGELVEALLTMQTCDAAGAKSTKTDGCQWTAS
jgi:hypothetical protein